MANEEYDEFRLDSGFKDDYDGTVIDAWFGTTEANPNLLLFLKVQADDGEEVENRYGCGDGWSSFDGGETAEHATKKFFNNRSKIGGLVAAAFDSGAEDAIRAKSKEVNNLGPRASKLWVGFRAHWNVFQEEFDMKDRTTGEQIKRTSTSVLPTKFIEFVGAGAEGKSSSTSSSAAPTGGGPLDSVDASVATQITLLAKTNDYPSWVDQVMALPDIVSNGTIMSALADQSFYEGLKG